MKVFVPLISESYGDQGCRTKKLLSIKGILIIMDLGSCERHINFKV